eukprot:COSAG02_NODE_30103_length_557_cov_0.792576_1_plen_163_part_01
MRAEEMEGEGDSAWYRETTVGRGRKPKPNRPGKTWPPKNRPPKTEGGNTQHRPHSPPGGGGGGGAMVFSYGIATSCVIVMYFLFGDGEVEEPDNSCGSTGPQLPVDAIDAALQICGMGACPHSDSLAPEVAPWVAIEAKVACTSVGCHDMLVSEDDGVNFTSA